MKRIFLGIIICVFVFNSNFLYADGPIKKLGRGIANIITCPVEITNRMGEANEDSGPVAAITWGVLNGIFRAVTRVAVGVYETVTFAIPFPNDYGPIIDDPEFFLEDGVF